MLWELQFFFPRWRLSSKFPRGPIGTPSAAGEVKLVFAGDLMVKSGDVPAEFDPQLRQMISSADLLFATLESPIVARDCDRSVRYPEGLRMPPFEMPIGFLEDQIARLGLAPQQVCVSVAANHAGDLGVAGFAESCALLETSGFQIVGRHGEGRHLIDVIDVGDIRLSVLAWTRWMNDEPFTRDEPAVNRQFNLENSCPRALLQAMSFDVAIALPHWGLEMRATPAAANREIAAKLLEQGFDLVVGSHPHMLQPIEIMGGKLCAYSLGNFTYTLSHIAKYGRSWRSCLSGLLQIGVDPKSKKITSYELVPIVEEFAGGVSRVWHIDNYPGPHKRDYQAMISNLFLPSNLSNGPSS
jgi:poly-gamma-glutamate synthesis protein (capsule biosynthesis protein)